MSKELKEFKKHFEANCSVKVIDTIEENHLPHWKRLCFNQLNCDEMIEISSYIKKTFSVEGKYSHLSPKLQIYNRVLCLTVDISQINDKIRL
jgi:hypothetical protein